MNYYPNNNYQSYPYPQGANQYPMYPQQQFQPVAAGLNGKLVDSIDVVRVTEVPIGGYGIFPKADLSEIYVKNWNNDGTTSIRAFKPMIQPKEEIPAVQDQILEKVNQLEQKIDSVLTAAAQKKEVKANAY